ncbi:hypothetical protein [Myroides odoratus]|uniref:hypothetical protein n=1 Tax=Myroides odoratus TaxID=256 RepID=UPI0039AF6F6B
MKKILIQGSLVLCLLMGVVACSSDDNQIKSNTESETPSVPGTETGTETGTNNGNTGTSTGQLLGKWRHVKTIEYDVNNTIVKEEVKSNETCSTATAYFLENDKIVFNTYTLSGNQCVIKDEYDGRWKAASEEVYINEDWRDTTEQHSPKKFEIEKLTADHLALHYNFAQGNLTKIQVSPNTMYATFIFEKVTQ